MIKLTLIQNELKAPKNQFNKFGNYHYRNVEDIMEAVKPLLLKHNCTLTIKDRVKTVNSVMFVESTVEFTDGDFNVKIKASAGIEPQKGMTLAQSFGASSSYARKYALSGLFLLDDNKDDDTRDNRPLKTVQESEKFNYIAEEVQKINDIPTLETFWNKLTKEEQKHSMGIIKKRKNELS